MIKTFNPIKNRRPWLLILISHLFQQTFLSSWPLFFYTWGAFGLEFFLENCLNGSM